MRLTLRFLVPLLVALALFAYAAVPLVDALTTRWFVRDLDMRSNLIANTVQEPLEDMIKAGAPARVLGFFQRLLSDERLYAVGLCLSSDAAPIATGAFPTEIRCSTSQSPRSAPERTSERGAGTRQAPCRQASHISSQEASKATDSPAMTRSPGAIGSSVRNSAASASTNAAALR